MPEIKRSALMPYPARFMYDIVNDVERYPEFLPWCGGARLEHADEHSMRAAILMQAAGLNHWFKTRNTMVAGESIEIELVEGPFSRLDGSAAAKTLRQAKEPIDFHRFHNTSRDPSICLASSIAGSHSLR